jgi:hypothetical protein
MTTVWRLQRKRLMIICEFCLQRKEDGACALGLKLPVRIGCREFDPGIEKFCANPSDFKGASQIIQMATFFEFKGKELKKIKEIAMQEEQIRLKITEMQTNLQTDALAVGK